MGFPFIPVALGALTAGKAASNFFANRGASKEIGRDIKTVRGIGKEATGFARGAVEGFQEFDPLEGFEEELASLTRAPLEGVRASAISRGAFRSGRAIADEQRVIGQESAALLTRRKQLQLQGLTGLSQAAGRFAEIGTAVPSGLIDFRQSQIDRRNTDLSSLLQAFLASRGGGN